MAASAKVTAYTNVTLEDYVMADEVTEPEAVEGTPLPDSALTEDEALVDEPSSEEDEEEGVDTEEPTETDEES